MKSLEEVIMESIVGSTVVNYRGEKKIVESASVGENYTGYNGSYVFTIHLNFTDGDYPIEIGLDSKVFVSLPTTVASDCPCGGEETYIGAFGLLLCKNCHRPSA